MQNLKHYQKFWKSQSKIEFRLKQMSEKNFWQKYRGNYPIFIQFITLMYELAEYLHINICINILYILVMCYCIILHFTLELFLVS